MSHESWAIGSCNLVVFKVKDEVSGTYPTEVAGVVVTADLLDRFDQPVVENLSGTYRASSADWEVIVPSTIDLRDNDRYTLVVTAVYNSKTTVSHIRRCAKWTER